MKKLIVYIILLIAGDAVADCNFQTANYINELNSPKNIEKIIKVEQKIENEKDDC